MIKRQVLRAAAEGPFSETMPAGQVREWAKNFAPNAVRRMSKLGLMLGAVLRDFPIEPEDAVIYATTFAEPIATERYLESFPAPSPLHFQTSIHPSGIEQVLINRGCPVRELTPMAGQAHLCSQAILTALLTPCARVLLTGGEETGTWFRDLDAASRVGFAFALELGDSGAGASAPLGELRWTEGLDLGRPPEAGAGDDLRRLFSAVSAREPLRCASPAGGEVSLHWF